MLFTFCIQEKCENPLSFIFIEKKHCTGCSWNRSQLRWWGKNQRSLLHIASAVWVGVALYKNTIEAVRSPLQCLPTALVLGRCYDGISLTSGGVIFFISPVFTPAWVSDEELMLLPTA